MRNFRADRRESVNFFRDDETIRFIPATIASMSSGFIVRGQRLYPRNAAFVIVGTNRQRNGHRAR